jgi:hypothetical protein
LMLSRTFEAHNFLCCQGSLSLGNGSSTSPACACCCMHTGGYWCIVSDSVVIQSE